MLGFCDSMCNKLEDFIIELFKGVFESNPHISKAIKKPFMAPSKTTKIYPRKLAISNIILSSVFLSAKPACLAQEKTTKSLTKKHKQYPPVLWLNFSLQLYPRECFPPPKTRNREIYLSESPRIEC